MKDIGECPATGSGILLLSGWRKKRCVGMGKLQVTRHTDESRNKEPIMFCEQCRKEINPRKSLCAVCGHKTEMPSGTLIPQENEGKYGLADASTREWVVNPIFDKVSLDQDEQWYVVSTQEGVAWVSRSYANGQATLYDRRTIPVHLTRNGERRA